MIRSKALKGVWGPISVFAAVAGFVVVLSHDHAAPRAAGTPKVPAHARDQALHTGRTRILVEATLTAPYVSEGLVASSAGVLAQRGEIGRASCRERV